MISIALCTYNGSKYIAEQLNSLLSQTVQPDEIVLCDDASSDDTVNIAKDIMAKWNGKFKLIRNKNNMGYRLNFQAAISECSGDIIFLCDQDDVWKNDKISIMKQAFFDNPKAMLIFHDTELVDADLHILYDSFWKILNFNYQEFLKDNYNQLLEYDIVQGCACAFKKELFDYAQPFCKVAFHDEWLALTAVAKGEVIPVPKKLLLYRQHQNVIGGLPLSFAQKLKKWYGSFYDAICEHLKNIERRRLIFSAYKDKVDTTIYSNNNFDFNEYLLFLDRRKKYIQYKNIKIIKLIPTYFKFDMNMINALKNIIKDVMAMFI